MTLRIIDFKNTMIHSKTSRMFTKSLETFCILGLGISIDWQRKDGERKKESGSNGREGLLYIQN